MKNPTSNSVTTRCSICKTAVARDHEQYPFCSARCKQIDLGRWVDEKYKITRPIEQRDLEEGLD